MTGKRSAQRGEVDEDVLNVVGTLIENLRGKPIHVEKLQLLTTLESISHHRLPCEDIIKEMVRLRVLRARGEEYLITRERIPPNAIEKVIAKKIVIRKREGSIYQSIISTVTLWQGAIFGLDRIINDFDAIHLPFQFRVQVLEFLSSQHLLIREQRSFRLTGLGERFDENTLIQILVPDRVRATVLDPGVFTIVVRYLFDKWHGKSLSPESVLQDCWGATINSIVATKTLFTIISKEVFSRILPSLEFFFGPWDQDSLIHFVERNILELVASGFDPGVIPALDQYMDQMQSELHRMENGITDGFDIDTIYQLYRGYQANRFMLAEELLQDLLLEMGKVGGDIHDPPSDYRDRLQEKSNRLLLQLKSAGLMKDLTVESASFWQEHPNVIETTLPLSGKCGKGYMFPPGLISFQQFKKSLSIARSKADTVENILPVENIARHLVLESGNYVRSPYKIPIGEILDSVKLWAQEPHLFMGRIIEFVKSSGGAIIESGSICNPKGPVADDIFRKILFELLAKWNHDGTIFEFTKNQLNQELQESRILCAEQRDLAVGIMIRSGMLRELYGDKVRYMYLPVTPRIIQFAKLHYERGAKPTLLAEILIYVLQSTKLTTGTDLLARLATFRVTTVAASVYKVLVELHILETKGTRVQLAVPGITVDYIHDVLAAGALDQGFPAWTEGLKNDPALSKDDADLVGLLEDAIINSHPVLPEQDIAILLSNRGKKKGSSERILFAIITSRVLSHGIREDTREKLHTILSMVVGTEIPGDGATPKGTVTTLPPISTPDSPHPAIPGPQIPSKTCLIQGELIPFQEEGVEFLVRERNAILAYDMGLGKTVMTIEFVLRERATFNTGEHGPFNVLIIVPNQKLSEWEDELDRFAPDVDVIRVQGTRDQRREQWTSEALVHLVNYEKVAVDYMNGFVEDGTFSHVIIDEAGRIKNNIELTRIIKEISAKAVSRVALSGTPLENNVNELWSITDFVKPGYLGSRANFNREFNLLSCKPLPTSDPAYQTQINRLRAQLHYTILSKKKEEVSLSIPRLTVHNDLVDLDRGVQKEHDRYPVQIENMLGAYTVDPKHRRRLRAEGLSKMEEPIFHVLDVAHKLCLIPSKIMNVDVENSKLKCLVALVGAIPRTSKIVIFTEYEEVANMIHSAIGDALVVSGKKTLAKRDEAIHQFRTDTRARVLISTSVCEKGMNLQCADTLINYDFHYNYARMDQRVHRVYRLGQKNEVTIINIVARNSIEATYYHIHKRKHQLICDVIEGQYSDPVFFIEISSNNSFSRAEFLRDLALELERMRNHSWE